MHEHEYEHDIWGPTDRIIRTVVTTEIEWDDEQQQIYLDYLDHKRMTARCGHHPAVGMAPGGRLVDHASLECLDCKAEELQRKKWIEANHPKHQGEPNDGSCKKCAAEVFWVERHELRPS